MTAAGVLRINIWLFIPVPKIKEKCFGAYILDISLNQQFFSRCGNFIKKLNFVSTPWKIKIPLENSEGDHICVVPPQSWGDRSDTKHSKCLLLGGRRLNQLTLIPKPKGSGGARAATAQVGPANNRNDTKRCLPVEASLRPGEAVPW